MLTTLAGCASRFSQFSSLSLSTQGTTLVQMASVTAVRELPVLNERTGANQMATELTLRFDDGKIRNFNIEPGEVFKSGERVKVTSRRGNIRIAHE